MSDVPILTILGPFPPTGVVHGYLSAVLSDVLHCQREPLPLCLALMQYDKEPASSALSASPHASVVHLHRYYSKWLPPQCREELVSVRARLTHRLITCHLFYLFLFSQFEDFDWDSKDSPSPASFSALMKAAYSRGPSAVLQDAFRKELKEALASMLLPEFPVAIKQILLYVQSTVENFGTVRIKHKLVGLILNARRSQCIVFFCPVHQRHGKHLAESLHGNTPGLGDVAAGLSGDRRVRACSRKLPRSIRAFPGAQSVAHSRSQQREG